MTTRALVFRGTWYNTGAYQTGDVVDVAGTLYACVAGANVTVSGTSPDADSTNWNALGGGGGGGVGPYVILGFNPSGDGAELPAPGGEGLMIPWDAAYTDDSTFGTTTVPDGLGLDITLDGIESNMVTTEEGIWHFNYGLGIEKDATGAFYMGPSGVGIIDSFFPDCSRARGSTFLPNFVETMKLPADVTFSWFAEAVAPVTNDPWHVTYGYLGITRLA